MQSVADLKFTKGKFSKGIFTPQRSIKIPSAYSETLQALLKASYTPSNELRAMEEANDEIEKDNYNKIELIPIPKKVE